MFSDAKRFIGLSAQDESTRKLIEEDKKLYPFDIRCEDNLLKFIIQNGECHVEQTPEDVSAELLRKIKNAVENFTKKSTDEA